MKHVVSLLCTIQVLFCIFSGLQVISIFNCTCTGFMQFVVLPLFEEWYRFSPTKLSQVMLDNVKSNKTNWDDMVKQDQVL